jgi:ribosomal protein S18 acetylase RimI-like enzyme
MNKNADFIHIKQGYCYFQLYVRKPAVIFGLYVEPEYRRKGYAKKLLQLVISEIRNTGYAGTIQIKADPQEDSISKEQLVTFYERQGLQVVNL